MAHQAHNIPWDALCSNLRWATDSGRKCHNATNLVPRMRPTQGKELTYFVEAFARNIDEHSECERKKYPERYDTPKATDTIIDETIAKKITPTLQRWLSSCQADGDWCGEGLFAKEHYRAGENRKYVIPDDERKMSAFLRKYTENPCYHFYKVNGDGFFNLELVKTLLLYGEMEPILRICAHPDVDLKAWWSTGRCYDTEQNVGWDQLCATALAAYISLNVIYCLPNTWDKESGKTAETDYRRTYFYQHMLQTCTRSGRASDIIAYPHRQFFGVTDDRSFSARKLKGSWRKWAKWANTGREDYVERRYPYGVMPFEEFLALEGPLEHSPNVFDVQYTRSMLCRKGLPVELAIYIMKFAGYEPKRRLKVPHDPFHVLNREELAQYLKYCWQILVRCDMMAKALDMKIDWKNEIIGCIIGLLCYKNFDYREWWDTEPDDEHIHWSYVFK